MDVFVVFFFTGQNLQLLYRVCVCVWDFIYGVFFCFFCWWFLPIWIVFFFFLSLSECMCVCVCVVYRGFFFSLCCFITEFFGFFLFSFTQNNAWRVQEKKFFFKFSKTFFSSSFEMRNFKWKKTLNLTENNKRTNENKKKTSWTMIIMGRILLLSMINTQLLATQFISFQFFIQFISFWVKSVWPHKYYYCYIVMKKKKKKKKIKQKNYDENKFGQRKKEKKTLKKRKNIWNRQNNRKKKEKKEDNWSASTKDQKIPTGILSWSSSSSLAMNFFYFCEIFFFEWQNSSGIFSPLS